MKYRILLIRHSLTEGNELGKYIGGSTDEGLSKAGQLLVSERADYYKGLIKETNFLLCSSPMKRCLECCQIVFPDKEVFVVDKLKEIDFGQFENKSYIDLNGNSKYQEWINSGGKLDFPDGEKQVDFINRSVEGFYEMVRNMKDNNITEAVCICHGGSIMAILSNITAKEYYSFQVKNTEGYYVEFSLQGEKIVSISYNRI